MAGKLTYTRRALRSRSTSSLEFILVPPVTWLCRCLAVHPSGNLPYRASVSLTGNDNRTYPRVFLRIKWCILSEAFGTALSTQEMLKMHQFLLLRCAAFGHSCFYQFQFPPALRAPFWTLCLISPFSQSSWIGLSFSCFDFGTRLGSGHDQESFNLLFPSRFSWAQGTECPGLLSFSICQQRSL